MRINVLGPLQMAGDTAGLTVSGAKRRTFLAALLLEANCAVSRARLVDAVWGGAPPVSASANIRTYASYLRQRLGPTTEGLPRLVGAPGEYVIKVGPDELDLLEFQRLADEGLAAARMRDLRKASSRLDVAMRLWRGRAFDGVEVGSWAADRVRAVEDRRWKVVAAWTEVQVALRRYDDVDRHLRELVTERPFSEGAWARLMSVMERSGRSLEALAIFDEAREVLRRRFGVEPGPELRAARERVRTRAPACQVEIPSQRRVPQSVTAACSLLTPPPIVGREHAAARLTALLVGASAPVGVAVSGSSGTGKTALVLNVAAQIRDRYPGGQLYHELGVRSVDDPLEVLGAILLGLGVAARELPASLPARSHLYRVLLARRAVLVVLDNAVDGAQVRPLLPGVGSSKVLVCGRYRLTGLTGFVQVRLKRMAVGDSLAMLSNLLGPQRVDQELGAARRIVSACAGNPAALSAVAARLAARPDASLSVLADRLADVRTRLDELDTGDSSIRSDLAASLAALPAEDQRAVRLIAAHPAQVHSVETLARVLRGPLDEADRVIDRLLRVNVLELVQAPIGGGVWYRLDELLALYAREVTDRRVR